ncbi:MAG: DUF2171 domain-containing protein [Chloroflexi bacterium]|nr:DUF2171 domain-containing protein [Chloroflexota bacterium]MCL5075022.1 DUF2171 domain-containing protein [Chloroflexota bacterium]
MNINVGSTVMCRTEEVGTVDRIVIDPRTKEAIAFVLRQGESITRDIVVPISLIDRLEDDRVVLPISILDLDQLPDYIDADYVTPETDWTPPPPYPRSQVLFPARRVEHAGVGKIEIIEGAIVECSDGQIGTVDEVIADPLSDRVTSFVVRKGPHLTRDAVIPVEWILKADADRIILDCNRDQIELYSNYKTINAWRIKKPGMARG